MVLQENRLSRRNFLALTSLGFASSFISGCTSREKKLGKIGLQLYTVRNEIEKDLAGTLKRISEIGFGAVETAFWPEHVTIEEAGKVLKGAGLSVCSAHCELPIGDKKSEMLRIAEAFDCSRMIWHGWPEDERYKTLDGTKELGELYNEANHFAKENGLRFGIHNHWWEFRNTIDGRFAYQVLLDHLENDVFFEIDTYWVKVAGHDPAKIVGEFGDRAPCLHIKDGPGKYTDKIATDPEPMVAVGSGTQNFPEVVKAADGNTEWMIVEIDKCDTDIFKTIKESHQYLVNNNLAIQT
jgi:sugar phosphate isomerase/epimerase